MGVRWTAGASIVILFTFWIVISENLAWDNLLVGLAVCALVVQFNQDIVVKPSEFPLLSFRRVGILLRYFFTLVAEVFKANVHVAKIVLNPNMPINPGLVVFRPGLKHDWNKVLLANSITLTPGSLTLDIDRDVYTVHLLDLGDAEELMNWSVLNYLRELED